MGRFASTVAYYESARPPYGAPFFETVARELGLDRSQRLLDVGAGPGILAIGFAPYCREARRRRSGAGHGRGCPRSRQARRRVSHVRRGPVRERRREARRIRYCHHRPRDPLARTGARASGARPRSCPWRGRVLVCGATSVKDGRNPWLKTFNAVRDRWRGDRPTRDHCGFFADGQFKRTGTIRVEGTYAVPVERLVERVLSMSTSSSDRIGDEVPVMKSAMREALAPFAAEGMIEDIVEARAEVFERA